MMCEGRKWRFLAFDESDLQFSLQCYIRIRPVGIMSVTFEDGDVYEWTQVSSSKRSFLKRLAVKSLLAQRLLCHTKIRRKYDHLALYSIAFVLGINHRHLCSKAGAVVLGINHRLHCSKAGAVLYHFICTVLSKPYLRASFIQVPIYIEGLVVGSLRLDHKGQTQVICRATGNRVALSVSGQGTLSRLWKGNNHQVCRPSHPASSSF